MLPSPISPSTLTTSLGIYLSLTLVWVGDTWTVDAPVVVVLKVVSIDHYYTWQKMKPENQLLWKWILACMVQRTERKWASCGCNRIPASGLRRRKYRAKSQIRLLVREEVKKFEGCDSE